MSPNWGLVIPPRPVMIGSVKVKRSAMARAYRSRGTGTRALTLKIERRIRCSAGSDCPAAGEFDTPLWCLGAFDARADRQPSVEEYATHE
jgi:hypothetical protein